MIVLALLMILGLPLFLAISRALSPPRVQIEGSAPCSSRQWKHSGWPPPAAWWRLVNPWPIVTIQKCTYVKIILYMESTCGLASSPGGPIFSMHSWEGSGDEATCIYYHRGSLDLLHSPEASVGSLVLHAVQPEYNHVCDHHVINITYRIFDSGNKYLVRKEGQS